MSKHAQTSRGNKRERPVSKQPTQEDLQASDPTRTPHLPLADPGAHVVCGGVETVRRGPVVAPVRLALELAVHAPLVDLYYNVDTAAVAAGEVVRVAANTFTSIYYCTIPKPRMRYPPVAPWPHLRWYRRSIALHR